MLVFKTSSLNRSDTLPAATNNRGDYTSNRGSFQNFSGCGTITLMPDGKKNEDSQVEVAGPGSVISPGSASQPGHEVTLNISHDEPAPQAAEPPAPPPEPQPEAAPPPPEPVPQAPVAPQPEPTPEQPPTQPTPEEVPAEPEAQGGFFNPEGDGEATAPEYTGPESVTWTAPEFIAHDKSSGWYISLVVADAILAFFVYILTRDKVSVAVVLVAGILFGVYGSHRPRELEYQLDRKGLTVGGKRYGFGLFKSYSLVPEAGLTSVVFMPIKRFGTSLTVYFAPEDQDRIMTVLSGSLPYEEARRDAVDNLMKKVRF